MIGLAINHLVPNQQIGAIVRYLRREDHATKDLRVDKVGQANRLADQRDAVKGRLERITDRQAAGQLRTEQRIVFNFEP